MRVRCLLVILPVVSLSVGAPEGGGENPSIKERMPENLYRGELVAYPGAWAFQIPRGQIILVSDQELIDLADPGKQINLALGRTPQMDTLRQICERAKAGGNRTLILA